MSGTAPVKPTDLRVDSLDRYLFGIDTGLNAVSMVRVHDGFLLERPKSPITLPSGATPSGIAVARIGQDQF